MKQIVYLLSVIVLASCSNKRQEKNVDTTSSLTEDSASIFSNAVTTWIDSNLHTSSSTLTLEERWQDDSVHKESYQVPEDFVKNYSPLLRWSPDSNLLDIGSYGSAVVPDKKGQAHLEQGEPDTEVALVDMKHNQRTRLLYVGPSAEILDGFWLNNSELMILSTFKSDGGVTDTLSWKIDLQENIFILYNVKASAVNN